MKLQTAKTFSPQALQKLEQFLIAGTERAISEGYTIVCRCYNPRENACDPIYASCLPRRTDATVLFDYQLPSYEEIFNDVMQETNGRFDWVDLKTVMQGIDTDKPFMHYTFYLTPHRNEELFNIGRRLRYKYVGMPGVVSPEALLPDHTDVPCISETEAIQYVETGELSNALFGHINSCKECRGKLEIAKGWQEPVQSPPPMRSSPETLAQQIEHWEQQQIKSLLGWLLSSLRSARSWFHRTLWGLR
jgi:hypothetical protein